MATQYEELQELIAQAKEECGKLFPDIPTWNVTHGIAGMSPLEFVIKSSFDRGCTIGVERMVGDSALTIYTYRVWVEIRVDSLFNTDRVVVFSGRGETIKTALATVKRQARGGIAFAAQHLFGITVTVPNELEAFQQEFPKFVWTEHTPTRENGFLVYKGENSFAILNVFQSRNEGYTFYGIQRRNNVRLSEPSASRCLDGVREEIAKLLAYLKENIAQHI